jgi:hypothetical protein
LFDMVILPAFAGYLALEGLESHLQIWEIFPKFSFTGNQGKQGMNMRITDDRYSRERLRMDLALRFIHHEARTHTIRAWTGLTDDRIRKLYRTYLLEADGKGVTRHRGKSPRQVAFFLRSQRMRRESAVFASVSSLFGLISAQEARWATAAVDVPRESATESAPDITRGALLCETFEAYRALVAEPQITFEHAVFLFNALLRGDELRLAGCRVCACLVVTDRLTLRPPACGVCDDAKASFSCGAVHDGDGASSPPRKDD